MKKENKTLMISTFLCILPSIISIFIYDKLPNELPSHFNFQGIPTSYKPKYFICFFIPLLVSIANIIAYFVSIKDPKQKNANHKLINIMTILMPLISIILVCSSVFISIGLNIKINIIIGIFVSIIFIVIGNYLPKCKPNYTLGIKLPWTLDDETNWKKTHRLGGFLFVICGIIIIIAILMNSILFYPVLILSSFSILLITTIYSFYLYKKSKRT